MPNFNSIYNTETVKILNELHTYEYTSPFKLREALERCELFSFAQELWFMVSSHFQCGCFKELCTQCERLSLEGRPLSEAGNVLAKNKQPMWHAYCENCKNPVPNDISGYVLAFLQQTCLSNPLCRPCSCKKQLTDFFEQISGEKHDSVKKNINNWLSGHSTPNTRENYIQLCYALGLRIFPEKAIKNLDANRFLSFSCGQNPLYLRNAEETVHYYCFMRPMGTTIPASEEYNRAENYRYALGLIEQMKLSGKQTGTSSDYTVQSRQLINQVENENELFAFINSYTESGSNRYFTAQELLCEFCNEYEDLLSYHDDNESRKKEGKKLTKSLAIQIVDILSKVSLEKSDLKILRKFIDDSHTLSDALYKSDIVKDMAEGRQTITRNILLLTSLALNYGTEYDVKSKEMRTTRDFDECTSFHSFCNTLTLILDSCNFAAVYPRRKIDFLVLHSYMLMTKDINKHGIADALSYYLMKTMELIEANE